MATAKQTAYRNRMITLIHVARRDLALEEGAYRAILKAQGSGESLSAMKIDDIKKVLNYLKGQGFKVRKAKADRKQAETPTGLKVRALWLMLHELGAVKDPSEAALTAYVRRIAKVDDVKWMIGSRNVRTADEPLFRGRAELVIETLKKWAMRYLPADVQRLKNEAVERHRQGLVSQIQSQDAAHAFNRAQAGEGFDIQCEVWNNLRAAVGRPFPNNP